VRSPVVLAIQLALIAVVLGLWQAAVGWNLVDSRLLPPPSEIAIRTFGLLTEPRMLRHLGVTATRVLVAFALVTPLGIALGLLLGENAYLGRAFKPFFYFVASVPKSVLLPIFILTLGIGFVQKVAFGMFQAIFVLVIGAIAASASVPAQRVLVARAFGASRWQIYSQIYWPSMLPFILEAVRLGMIFNITGIIFAEMYVSPDGLGYLIGLWGQSFQIPDLLAGIAVAAGLSIVVNEALRGYERRVSRWRT
jgi:NitT/TauT family transport system permease protein